MLAAGRPSREPVRPPGCSSWSPSNRRPPPARGHWRRRLSKSATKARIEPEHGRRIVDILRFRSRPIPPRTAFAADSDTLPPRTAPGAPPAPSHARPSQSPRRSGPRTVAPSEKGSMTRHRSPGDARDLLPDPQVDGRERRLGERVPDRPPERLLVDMELPVVVVDEPQAALLGDATDIRP